MLYALPPLLLLRLRVCCRGAAAACCGVACCCSAAPCPPTPAFVAEFDRVLAILGLCLRGLRTARAAHARPVAQLLLGVARW
jgi:hypothetical protein